jgi:hypothetical protein
MNFCSRSLILSKRHVAAVLFSDFFELPDEFFVKKFVAFYTTATIWSNISDRD